MDTDPEPEPRSKGEFKRQQILNAIMNFIIRKNAHPNIQDLMDISGIRSFNTLTRHLQILKQDGLIEMDSQTSLIKPRLESGE